MSKPGYKGEEKSEKLWRYLCDGYADITKYMEGELLTQIEIAFPDGAQQEAFKSMARKIVWNTHSKVIDVFLKATQDLAKILKEDVVKINITSEALPSPNIFED